VVRTVIAPDEIAVEIAEAVGWLASLVDRRCQTTKPSKSTQTNIRTARRPRIRLHLMGTVASRRIHRLPGVPIYYVLARRETSLVPKPGGSRDRDTHVTSGLASNPKSANRRQTRGRMYGDLNTGRKSFKRKILPVTYCASRISLQNRGNIMISIDRGAEKEEGYPSRATRRRVP
jgi:hypothetical protein